MLVETDGIWTIENDICISEWVRQRRSLDWDYQLLHKLNGWLGDYGRGTCLDVGAFIGDYTATFAKWFDRVFAFEPNTEAYECLKRNVPDRHVYCFNVAVGDHGSHYEFNLNRENPGASQTVLGETGLCFLGLDGIRGVDFIKIDVEGGEPGVLRACEDIIINDRPAMLVEQRVGDGNEDWVYAFLKRHNYRWRVVSGDVSCQYDLFCEPC